MFRSSITAVAFLVALAILPGTAAPAAHPYPKDLKADHWAYAAAKDLAARGILSGFPDGTFRAGKPVDRATLAVALSKSLQTLEAASGQGLSLPPRDLKTMARLTKEFSKELSELALRTSALEDKVENHRTRIEELSQKLEEVAEKVPEQSRFRFKSGEVRLVGYDLPEIRSNSNLILRFDYNVNEKVSGVFAPQVIISFDRGLAESVGIWEAYTDIAGFGPVDRIRGGRQLVPLGAGLVLCDRVEGIELSTNYADMAFQAIFLGDLILNMDIEAPSGQRLGFYYIEETKNGYGYSPIHLGGYLAGHIGSRLYLGLEYANYGNRVMSYQNNNTYTEAYLGDLRYRPSDSVELRLAYIAEEEDFRALSIDRDLSYHSDAWSPLEDVLQALVNLSAWVGTPMSRSEVNGFTDCKAGIEFKLPHSRFRLGLDVDIVRSYTNFFDNTGNEFNLYSARLKRPLANGSWAEFRARRLQFDQPSPLMPLGTLGIPRVDFTEFRLQWFTRF